MQKNLINDPCRECDILEERNLFFEQNHPQSQASLEGKLQHAEMRYKRLAEAAFEGIVIHDYHHFIEANQSFLNMFGYTQTEIGEINGDDLITPEYLEITRKQKES